ncbi:MAG TPA: thermostable hemolysin [Xanthomonadales bacterium]|nr:thermostable hemolysin [Xanthomonadales bacterium]
MTAIANFAPSLVPALAPAVTSNRLLRLLSPLPSFEVFLPEAPERHLATQYVADQFKVTHGASVHDFMPLLLGMSCQGQFKAVSGIRPAAGHALFLEQYLGSRIETVLSQVSASEVRRNKVVEVGNLVATQSGASQLLFLLLTVILHRCEFDWVVFTGTPVVIKGLERLGFKLERLCPADPSRLTSSKLEDWGQYYEQRPQVVAGYVPGGIRTLSEHKLYTAVLALFEPRINQLAPAFRTPGLPYGTHAVPA